MIFPANDFSQSCRATALIIVLWLVIGLAAITVVFGHSMMLEYRAAENFRTDAASRQAALGITRYAAILLRDETLWGQTPDDVLYTMEALPVGQERVWLIGRGETDESETPAFGLIHENAKLNLNTATREMLAALPGMTEEIAAAIIDWRDQDSDLTQDGAEDQQYLFLDPPRECKDAPFESVQELMLVNGMDKSILYGEDLNRNGILDPNENDGDAYLPLDNADGELNTGLIEFVTVVSRESNFNTEGEKRVNVKDNNSRQAVQEILTNALGEDRGPQALNAAGNLENINSILAFYLAAGLSLEECSGLDEVLTVSNDNSIPGLININFAPSQVLAAIPGIGEDHAEAIIAYRERQTPENLNSVRWIAEVLEQDDARNAGPWITTRTYQFLVDAVAVSRDARGISRYITILDMADTTPDNREPMVLLRRNESGRGWPLGQIIREELSEGYVMETNR